MLLESTQVYSDRGPYLNPSDHPYEINDDDFEDEDDDDENDEEDDFDAMECDKTQEPSYMDQAWAVARVVIGMVIMALAVFFMASAASADETAILTIAYEASSQSFEGQVAVASVIKARMERSGKSAKETVLKPYQFSCWNPKTHQPAQKRKLSQREIDMAKKAWAAARPGAFDHYCRYDCRPLWAKSAKKSVRIGDHVFYKI